MINNLSKIVIMIILFYVAVFAQHSSTYYQLMGYNYAGVKGASSGKTLLFSVRCVQHL